MYCIISADYMMHFKALIKLKKHLKMKEFSFILMWPSKDG